MLIHLLEEKKEIVPETWLKITQAQINQFAIATEDEQWIHVDEERCKKESPFKTTIAHGFLTISLLSKAFAKQIHIDPSKQTLINYGMDSLRFLEPVRSNDEIRFCFSLQDREVKTKGVLHKFNVRIEIKGRETPAAMGQFLVLLIE